jgi:hypothetical protein
MLARSVEQATVLNSQFGMFLERCRRIGVADLFVPHALCSRTSCGGALEIEFCEAIEI